MHIQILIPRMITFQPDGLHPGFACPPDVIDRMISDKQCLLCSSPETFQRQPVNIRVRLADTGFT
ncbi:hypothetical protein D3C73_1447300 [compost metagenome]